MRDKYLRTCEYCGKEFMLNPRTGLRWAEKTGRGKYCSTKCKKLSQKGKHFSKDTEFSSTNTEEGWRNHPRFIDGYWSYDKFKQDRCFDCGSTDNLLVHHIDGDRHNNSLDNLRTVCSKCHTTIYHPRKFYGNQFVHLGGNYNV